MIEIEELTKSYKGHTIFDKLNLKIPKGKMTAIYGASGAGKSTLLNIIGMIEDYDDGKYYFEGKFAPAYNSPAALKLRRKHISYLFQNFALIEDESIEKNLLIALSYIKLSMSQKRKKMKEILKQVHIDHRLNTKVYSLSGGEKQRVAVARALLKESELILADEPTGSLDEKNRNEVVDLLRKEVEKGKTVVIVTHDPYVRKKSDLVIEIGS
ncbi:ABC transporter ATP-binding protein [Lactococcus nasutitermitis]|uniref:ABC transporter ATP-binding protein n=1 Tax=Lactococcus nasutitermitis TaxID=1652957 RepID=A0ABV9JDS6_9LACT|nr:ABC transporter ATP-binding protein [Lactococcus nasutitermitis]